MEFTFLHIGCIILGILGGLWFLYLTNDLIKGKLNKIIGLFAAILCGSLFGFFLYYFLIVFIIIIILSIIFDRKG